MTSPKVCSACKVKRPQPKDLYCLECALAGRTGRGVNYNKRQHPYVNDNLTAEFASLPPDPEDVNLTSELARLAIKWHDADLGVIALDALFAWRRARWSPAW